MSYILGQYNKNTNVHDDNIFMTLVTSGTVRRRESRGDSEVLGSSTAFYDECIQVNALSNTKNYYFHGKIKRMEADQTFYVKLVYYSPSTAEENIEQYIKTINVSKGDPFEWVDIEFVFSPLLSFNCILFELQRTVDDYRTEIRYPKIAYQELSVINNIISSRIEDGVKLIKIGVQSHPGLLMCINGEEIRTCRTGVYELKNGIMTVSFFSVVAGTKEAGTSLVDWMNTVNSQIDVIIDLRKRNKITAAEAERRKAAIPSKSFFNSSKQDRVIDSFTLDYMYQDS